MVQSGILKREAMFYKVVFIAMMTYFNLCLFARPELLGPKMYKNYLKIGRINEVDRLQFQLMTNSI
jgi:hypothetical protein